MTSSIFEPVNMGYIPILEIEDALDRSDSASVWRAATDCTHQDAFFQSVQEHAFNKVTPVYADGELRKVVHSSLFFIPIVVVKTTETTDPHSKDLTPELVAQISSLVQQFSPTSSLCIFQSLMSYAEIASRDPVELRTILRQITYAATAGSTSQEPNIQFSAEPAFAPAGAPQLLYLVGAMIDSKEPPKVPVQSSKHSRNIIPVLTSLLRIGMNGAREDDEVTVHLGTSQQDAIETGFHHWIDRISLTHEIRAWDAMPAGQDRVHLALQIQEEDTLIVNILARSYQVGTSGVERMIAHVQGVANAAPTVEQTYVQ